MPVRDLMGPGAHRRRPEGCRMPLRDLTATDRIASARRAA